jgi:hypothetical protein
MLHIKKRYVVNESNEPVAVQLDLATFEKIERLLEDYALGQKIKETQREHPLNRISARKRYAQLRKAHRE